MILTYHRIMPKKRHKTTTPQIGADSFVLNFCDKYTNYILIMQIKMQKIHK